MIENKKTTNKEIINNYMVKILTEKIEKISGKKVELNEDVKDYESVYNQLRAQLRLDKLGEVIRIDRHSNVIKISCTDNNRTAELFNSVSVVMNKKDFKKQRNKKIKDNVFAKFVDNFNTTVLVQVI